MWMCTVRSIRVVAPVLLAISAVACGSTTGPDQVVDTRPARASVTATFSNVRAGLSPLQQFNFRVQFDLVVRETAGLGVKVNFIRADFRDRNGNFLERQEAGAIQFQRIPGNGSQTYAVTFDYNSDAFSAVVTVNATDDRGNILETTVTIS